MGPVNSGKTRLMEKVLEDLPTKSNLPAPIYPINLQKRTFNSVEALVHSLSSNMGSWLKQIVESVDEVSFKAAMINGKGT